MPLSPKDFPNFKMIRSVRGGGERRCPKCKKETLVVVEQISDQRTGVLCATCGWNRADLKSERHDVACASCKQPMGFVELVEKAVPKKYLCVKCTKERRDKKIEADSEGFKIRHKMLCEAGCGKQTMWLDFPETETGPAPEKLRAGLCKPCASKVKPSVPKNTAEERLIQEAVADLKKKRDAGIKVTDEEMVKIVGNLTKALLEARAGAAPAPSPGP